MDRNTPKAGKVIFRNYAAVLMFALSGPSTFSLYVVALWGLTADLGLTQCFPWADGPLSNWMVWLGLALTLNALAPTIHPTRTPVESEETLSDRLIRAGGKILAHFSKEASMEGLFATRKDWRGQFANERE